MVDSKNSIAPTLPFSLAELNLKEDHQIPVYPANQHWLAAMRDQKSQHPEDSTPVEKLMNCLVLIEDHEDKKQQVWGLKLAKKDCVFVAERKEIERQAAAKNKAITRFYRLIQKIAKSLKMSVPKVQDMVRDMYKHVEVLDPWLEQITDALTELNVTDITVATATVMIQQRLNRVWTQYDTLALPEPLFNQILDYYNNEERAWIEPKEEVMSEELEVMSEEDTQDSQLIAQDSTEGKSEPKQITPSKSTSDT